MAYIWNYHVDYVQAHFRQWQTATSLQFGWKTVKKKSLQKTTTHACVYYANKLSDNKAMKTTTYACVD